MWLENYESIDDGPILSSGREQGHDQYQEQARRAQSQLKKIQKDEKHSQNDNHKLFLILSRFIEDPYYESLIEDVSLLLASDFPSRGIISFIALFYPGATLFLSEILGKKQKINLLLELPRYPQKTEFNEDFIDIKIRNWISEWIQLMHEFLLHESASVLMNKKILTSLEWENASLTQKVLADFLIFFFDGRNIMFPPEVAQKYAQFIKINIVKKLQKYLAIQQESIQELISDSKISTDNLFWI